MAPWLSDIPAPSISRPRSNLNLPRVGRFLSSSSNVYKASTRKFPITPAHRRDCSSPNDPVMKSTLVAGVEGDPRQHSGSPHLESNFPTTSTGRVSSVPSTAQGRRNTFNKPLPTPTRSPQSVVDQPPAQPSVVNLPTPPDDSSIRNSTSTLPHAAPACAQTPGYYIQPRSSWRQAPRFVTTDGECAYHNGDRVNVRGLPLTALPSVDFEARRPTRLIGYGPCNFNRKLCIDEYGHATSDIPLDRDGLESLQNEYEALRWMFSEPSTLVNPREFKTADLRHGGHPVVNTNSQCMPQQRAMQHTQSSANVQGAASRELMESPPRGRKRHREA